jgi:hypothetical protein
LQQDPAAFLDKEQNPKRRNQHTSLANAKPPDRSILSVESSKPSLLLLRLGNGSSHPVIQPRVRQGGKQESESGIAATATAIMAISRQGRAAEGRLTGLAAMGRRAHWIRLSARLLACLR